MISNRSPDSVKTQNLTIIDKKLANVGRILMEMTKILFGTAVLGLLGLAGIYSTRNKDK